MYLSFQTQATNNYHKGETMAKSQSNNLTRTEFTSAKTLLKRLEDSYRVQRRFARFIVSELTRIEWRTIDQLWLESPNVRTTSNAYVDMKEVLEEMVGSGILEMSRGANPKFNLYRLVRS